FRCKCTRSVSSKIFARRASVRSTLSIGRLAAGRNGTRGDPPNPLIVELNAALGNGTPVTRISGVAACADAKVEICDSRQPVPIACANPSVFTVNFGSHVEL